MVGARESIGSLRSLFSPLFSSLFSSLCGSLFGAARLRKVWQNVLRAYGVERHFWDCILQRAGLRVRSGVLRAIFTDDDEPRA